jgi:uncharacterized membrane protein
MFVHFPVALWTTSVVWDALGLWLGAASWWTLSYWSLAAGLAIALPAVASGFAEFLRIPKDDPAEKTAIRHMYAMSGATILFLGSLLLHRPAGAPQPLLPALAASLAGLVLLTAGGVLAARLVYGYGVGMQR